MDATAVRARLPWACSPQTCQGSLHPPNGSWRLGPTSLLLLVGSNRRTPILRGGLSRTGGLTCTRSSLPGGAAEQSRVRKQRRRTACTATADESSSGGPEESTADGGSQSSRPGVHLYETEEGNLVLVDSESATLNAAPSGSAPEASEPPDGQRGPVGTAAAEAPGGSQEFILQVHIPRPPSAQQLQHTFEAAARAVRRNAVAAWLLNLPAAARRRRLERLEAAADEDPRNAEKEASYLLELNRSSPAAVIERFEKREHAADSGAVVEYLRALVSTDGIARYLPSDKEGRGATLPALLEDLSARAAGDAPPPTPGLSEQVPLHVVIKGDKKVEAGPTRLLRAVVGRLLLFSLVGVAWVLAAAWIRKNVSLSVSQSAAGGAATAGNYAPKEYNKENLPEKSVKTFADVKGCDEAKAELEEIVEYLRSPAKFTRLGGKLPKGVLLTGPPGTGKTLLAKAIAGEAGVPFFYRAGSEFEEMFVGVGARRVRALFAAAKKKAPCIVFIDEIDAVGGSRKQWESHTRKTLNQLLVEMDGFESSDGIIVLAATNLPETLDAALTRPGRFDRHVAVPNPDIKGRTDILGLYLAGKPVAADVDVGVLARGTVGFSGADLANLVNVAAVKAAVDGTPVIGAEQLEYAKDKIMMGAERKSAVLSEESRKLTAYHESGHAVVAIHTLGAQPIHKATITPRGNALGMVTQLPDKDEDSVSMRQMLARLDVCMGGRVAEEMIFGADQVTSGARSDLKQATNLARHMVTECGMSDVVGPIFVADSPGGDFQKKIDGEVMRLLKEAYARVRSLLAKHESDLHKLAQALLDRETLTSKEIQDLMNPEKLIEDVHIQQVKLPSAVT